MARSWAPQKPVCWYCNRLVGSPHAPTCEFEGIVPPPPQRPVTASHKHEWAWIGLTPAEGEQCRYCLKVRDRDPKLPPVTDKVVV